MNERTSVLVVDDVVVRIAVAGHLRSNCHFQVYEAAHAREAIAILSVPRLHVDAVLCDVELPGEINGFSLKQWAIARKPDLHFILSGTPERAAKAAVTLCEQGHVLPRPYDMAAVEGHIRRLMASGARSAKLRQ